jgi:peroxiredoxin family protein
MLPNSINDVPLSKGNFGGLGKRMLGKLMTQKGVDDLPALANQARELGAHFHCCDTSLQLFGWGCEDLIEGEQSEWCGVTAFLSLAFKSKVTLFI